RAVGDRQAERAALDDSGRDARRLLGAHPDGAPRDQSALLRHHRRLSSAHRLPGDRQHLVQRPRRADRVYARRRLSLLHAHQHGCAGARELHPPEGRPGAGSERRIVAPGVRAGLDDGDEMTATQPALIDRPERISAAAYWELLMNLTKREVKGRYSQSFFGVAWAIAQPLATMAVFTLVFSRLAKMPSGGAPYPLFAFAALVPWFF